MTTRLRVFATLLVMIVSAALTACDTEPDDSAPDVSAEIVDLAEAVRVQSSDVVASSPVTGGLVGREVAFDELAVAALTRSDNTAGNLLLRRLGGPHAITTFARSVGDGASRLDRWETELNTAVPGDERDTTTAAAFASGLRTVLAGDALAPEARARLVGWMRRTETSTTRTRALLPPGWTTADKSGSGHYGTSNAAGLVLAPDGRRHLLVVLTRDGADRPDAPWSDGLIARIAAATTAVAGTGR